MPPRPDEIVARARALIGARFRPQGRSAATGLDCIGVVAVAIGARDVPADYALRGGTVEALAAELVRAGPRAADGPARGDVLLMRPGAGQLHLGIFTGGGFVHADAGLRRVVERPLPLPWPILGSYRIEEE
jgi:murein DD-endopeptidase / murein LD-carboxypeptidase